MAAADYSPDRGRTARCPEMPHSTLTARPTSRLCDRRGSRARVPGARRPGGPARLFRERGDLPVSVYRPLLSKGSVHPSDVGAGRGGRRAGAGEAVPRPAFCPSAVAGTEGELVEGELAIGAAGRRAGAGVAPAGPAFCSSAVAGTGGGLVEAELVEGEIATGAAVPASTSTAASGRAATGAAAGTVVPCT